MSNPPTDRAEFWIRFVCAFFFFGIVWALLGLRFVDSVGLIPTAVGCTILTLIVSIYVAQIGDDGWRNFTNFIRWW